MESVTSNNEELDTLVEHEDSGQIAEPETQKEYGFTMTTQLLFREYFKVIDENDNQLKVKCLNCKSVLQATEAMTSNLTRHLVRSKFLNKFIGL